MAGRLCSCRMDPCPHVPRHEPMELGSWRASFAVTVPCPNGFWTVDEVGGPGGCEVETRQACSDLIALLERVRERLSP